jgi:hypothetical protein
MVSVMRPKQPPQPPQEITFCVNVILPPAEPGAPLKNRFIRAGDPSPYHELSEVPEAFRAYIGMPTELPPSPQDIYDEGDPFEHLPENVQAMLRRRAAKELQDAAALNQLKSEQTARAQKAMATNLAERLHEADQQPNYRDIYKS